ncbi:MAG TPA: hypothetical protein VGD73_31305 [Pseudonocardia sp.]|jgi:hypothetical protein|uniref:hypothetical protein n=1 Tax=Pseudonocardia sp. TaxID=60912 RepID=UPI002ED8F134
MNTDQSWPPRPVPGGQPGAPTPGAEHEAAAAGGEPEGPLARVAAEVAALDGLRARPTGEHVAAFERVHIALTDALSAIDGA